MSQYQNIRIEQHDRVVVVRLDRPKVLNALDEQTMHEVVGALQERDGDPSVGCFVLTGSERAFAAGADIAEMAALDAAAAHARDLWAGWDGLTALRTPLVGAVAGHALGGGCELAMMCDVLLAADTARFGQPEVGLGILPGMGGTQRLARAVGKAKAMEMCLTGRVMDAQEAERAGLVARVVPADRLDAEALELAAVIAAKSKPATMMVKEAVNAASEMPLQQGVRFERRLFHSAFAQPDQAEGMAAFLEKREPRFSRG